LFLLNWGGSSLFPAGRGAEELLLLNWGGSSLFPAGRGAEELLLLNWGGSSLFPAGRGAEELLLLNWRGNPLFPPPSCNASAKIAKKKRFSWPPSVTQACAVRLRASCLTAPIEQKQLLRSTYCLPPKKTACLNARMFFDCPNRVEATPPLCVF